jgi:hypothetical protein
MKHLYTALVFFSYSTFAQITITKHDMPAANDSARYSTTVSVLNFTNTGANYTWDYSSFTPYSQGVDFFSLSLLIGLTDIGIPSTNTIDFSELGLSDVNDFYKTSSSYFEINAIGASLNNIPIPFLYTTPDKVYQFPLTYGRIDTSAYNLNLTVPGVGGVHQVGTRINIVDGWGNVITPYDTFPCIRVKSVINEVDSLDLDTLSIGIPVPKVTYKWLANGVTIPVLEVDGIEVGNTFIPSSIKYKDKPRVIQPLYTIAIDFTASETLCTTRDTIGITPTVTPFFATGVSYQYTIAPNTFSYVSGTANTSEKPKVNFTAPGLYTVSLYVSANGITVPTTADTTKVNYILVTYPAGINQISADNSIKVYPNPAHDHLSCLLHGNAEQQTTIALTDIAGQTAYTITTRQQGEINIPTAGMPAGEYLLKATPESGNSSTYKISIVH